MNKILLFKTNPFQFSPQSSLSYTIPLIHTRNPNFFFKPPIPNSLYTPKIQTLCISTPSDPSTYAGWDDFQPPLRSSPSGESTHLQKFLISLGINDKKYIFIYLLGFVCALAVTRLRVSSVVAISAFVIVFGCGLVIGYVNGGHLKLSGAEKGRKDEIFRGYTEKLNCLVDILKGVDATVGSLKDGVERNISNDRVTLDDLKGVIRKGESVDSLVLNAKSVVEGLLESVVVEDREGEKNVIKKLNKRTKERGENGFGLSRFVARLFSDKLVGLNPTKKKDSSKREIKDGALGNMLSPAVEDQFMSTRSNEKHYNVNRRTSPGDRIGNDIGMFEMYGGSERIFDSKEYPYKNKGVPFIDNRRASLETNSSNRYSLETWDSIDNDVSSIDFRVGAKQTQYDLHYKQEKLPNLDSMREGETEIDNSCSQKERSRQEEVDQDFSHENIFKTSPSIVSDDKEFSEYLEEANLLLREAKKVLVLPGNDGNAEQVLYKSARILSKAIELRPMSLLAVGQLGNTYLLHGELKLRISRELRAILAGKDSFSMDMWVLNNLDDKLDKNDKLMSALVSTCEECEDLLIKAGRNYRLALSIDGNDMRALYNWGLALSFRGQLIADIGPGAARDADRVFLAAIDKFDAMLSKSNVYAPQALFRWGRALQQRSRLRPRNNKEKLKFLQQARRLYEDALDMDSKNFQVQEALSTCISELNFWYT